MKQVSIRIGGAVGFSCVAVSMIHGYIERETEKAYKIQEHKGKHSCWFPKAALELVRDTYGYNDSFTLAKWFNGSNYQNWFLEKYTEVSGISG